MPRTSLAGGSKRCVGSTTPCPGSVSTGNLTPERASEPRLRRRGKALEGVTRVWAASVIEIAPVTTTYLAKLLILSPKEGERKKGAASRSLGPLGRTVARDNSERPVAKLVRSGVSGSTSDESQAMLAWRPSGLKSGGTNRSPARRHGCMKASRLCCGY
jgi:hypothetical protein